MCNADVRVVEEVGAGAEGKGALIGARSFCHNGRSDRQSAEVIFAQRGGKALHNLVRRQEFLLSEAVLPLDEVLPRATPVQTELLGAGKQVS